MNQSAPSEAAAALHRPGATPPRRINGCDVIAIVNGASIIEHPRGFMVYRAIRIGTRNSIEAAITLAQEAKPMAEGTGAETAGWCQRRSHPLVTFNPELNMSLCRCGERLESGEQPLDWEAKRDIFHSCLPDGPCSCYLK
ncbi:hypothetical protein GCM10010441_29530 [Kitasatospora paracochleata]|uniref:Uncharacterized protein n=1 Tax=Kitasatospora paracochleata TaxID=58354 RepID=A0ABT1J8Z4_9ACTN|nr:hypothetical protein [Kitasatospora paracochleata]MCP2313914.1 hypothetical protein [Kitasatospora paracochleata]